MLLTVIQGVLVLSTLRRSRDSQFHCGEPEACINTIELQFRKQYSPHKCKILKATSPELIDSKKADRGGIPMTSKLRLKWDEQLTLCHLSQLHSLCPEAEIMWWQRCVSLCYLQPIKHLLCLRKWCQMLSLRCSNLYLEGTGSASIQQCKSITWSVICVHCQEDGMDWTVFLRVEEVLGWLAGCRRSLQK